MALKFIHCMIKKKVYLKNEAFKEQKKILIKKPD